MITKSEARERLSCNVRRIRAERGLTQVELATMANIDQGTISRLERSQVLPNAADLANLAEVLDTTIDSLMDAAVTANLVNS